MVGVYVHLGCEVHGGATEVSHYRPFSLYHLGKVGKCLLYPGHFVGSVAALARCFMPLSEVGLIFDEVGLEFRPLFFILRPPYPTIFRVLYCFCNKYVHDADKLGIYAQLTRCQCKVGALVQSLNDTFKCIFRLVAGAGLIFIFLHVHGVDVGAMQGQAEDNI